MVGVVENSRGRSEIWSVGTGEEVTFSTKGPEQTSLDRQNFHRDVRVVRGFPCACLEPVGTADGKN